MWTLKSLLAPAFGLVGAADSPWKPRAAWAAGTSARHDAASSERNPLHDEQTSSCLLVPALACYQPNIGAAIELMYARSPPIRVATAAGPPSL